MAVSCLWPGYTKSRTRPAVDGKPSQVVRVPGMGAVRLYIFDSRKVHDGSL
ncbi:hypothetical protein [Xanthomonas citri]|uniref:hypothetical protein n=1 Tax=Xanthomonas citri TaxID=346 RepID=UPI001314F9D7|nr:hypothetical protein [Xanthomonas citri]QTJ32054.1 hypothetical protein XcfCFBP6165P_23140 [Xanthomonas citri pv. phaseoli var. fuscans]QTL01500.1 hypothetical protein J4T80_18550 [Xanthomonas citri pv. fuscans]